MTAAAPAPVIQPVVPPTATRATKAAAAAEAVPQQQQQQHEQVLLTNHGKRATTTLVGAYQYPIIGIDPSFTNNDNTSTKRQRKQ